MSNLDYIHLQSPTMTPGNMTDQASVEAQRTWLCTGCSHPKPGVEGVDAHLRNRSLTGTLNVVFGFGVSLARLSFLLRLGEHRVARDLYLGKVFGPDKSCLNDWVTFRGKRRLVVRGTEHVSHRVCPVCGSDVYFAMGSEYLYPQPATDVEIFESSLFGLILPENVANEVGIAGEMRGVTVERLTVLPEPKDGLPPLYF